MSTARVLDLVAGPTSVTARLLDDGRERALVSAPLRCEQHDDRFLVAADEVWAATLSAAADALEPAPEPPDVVRIGPRLDSVVLWDRETLGTPGPAVVSGAGDPGFLAGTLVALRRQEPHTWALLEEGRYAVGSLESYLVARMTRGVWHVTVPLWMRRTDLADAGDPVGGWSAAACAAAGIPIGALPEVLRSWAGVTTDAASFLGLAVAVAG